MASRKKRDVNLVVRGKAEREARIIELQIQISPRGRSTIHGTVLHDGMIKEITRQLHSDDIDAIARLLFGVILYHDIDSLGGTPSS